MKAPILLAALVLGAACNSPLGPDTSHPLRVNARDGTLQLANTSDQRVFYFIYERQAAALINWAPCVDPLHCASVAPHAQDTLPYSSIGGYLPGKTEAILFWWYAAPRPGAAPVPGQVAAMVLTL
jgi:hypothetical protein